MFDRGLLWGRRAGFPPWLVVPFRLIPSGTGTLPPPVARTQGAYPANVSRNTHEFPRKGHSIVAYWQQQQLHLPKVDLFRQVSTRGAAPDDGGTWRQANASGGPEPTSPSVSTEKPQQTRARQHGSQGRSHVAVSRNPRRDGVPRHLRGSAIDNPVDHLSRSTA